MHVNSRNSLLTVKNLMTGSMTVFFTLPKNCQCAFSFFALERNGLAQSMLDFCCLNWLG